MDSEHRYQVHGFAMVAGDKYGEDIRTHWLFLILAPTGWPSLQWGAGTQCTVAPGRYEERN